MVRHKIKLPHKKIIKQLINNIMNLG